MKIILASGSPRRIQLLRQWGVKFSVHPSNVDEKTKLTRPSAIVKELALRKASSVAKKVKSGLVIGADTIVVLRGKIIGKPVNHKDALKILNSLNGSYHKVYTGVAVIDSASGKKIVDYEVSSVKMRKLDQQRIKELSGKHLDKAGAYAIQEKNDSFVERIKGDYFNVVGLPYKKTMVLLRELM